MRLHEGQKAPSLAGETTDGKLITLSDLRGRTVLLKFYRFAACPICNLHLRDYVRRAGEVSAAGITVVAVFHSPGRRLTKSLRKLSLPFPVIADPEKRLFKAFGVEASWRGMFTQGVARDYARAMGAGFFSGPLGHEGGIKGHPADFLIDGQGVIRLAHYGRDYTDTLDVDRILELAAQVGLIGVRAQSV
jgi:thioredoxin-dependent peroxiredoxin